MEWGNVISALLAGGLAGQITTLVLGSSLQRRRELSGWIRAERFKLFSELLGVVSAYASREEFDQWPDEIRVLSQKVHLLSPGGNASESVSIAMQTCFALALDRKLGRAGDLKVWRDSMRDASRMLRQDLAAVLHSC
jgi:hypothetical protein